MLRALRNLFIGFLVLLVVDMMVTGSQDATREAPPLASPRPAASVEAFPANQRTHDGWPMPQDWRGQLVLDCAREAGWDPKGTVDASNFPPFAACFERRMGRTR